MRLALTAGGTGGHIFPALAVLQSVRETAGGEVEARFFGPDDRGERALVEQAGLTFEAVPAAAVRGRGPLALARSSGRIAGGVWAAVRKLRAFRPDVVFSTGGYGSFPASVAARMLRLPLVVYLPDVSPGWAVRVETRLATRMATTTEAALDSLPRQKTSVTGYPVRDEFFTLTREVARARLGIAPDEKVILVAGASQGAKAINEVVFHGLRTFVEIGTLIHITGAADYAEAEGYRGEELGDLAARYLPARFRDDMPTVMVAADIAVMRAGASTLGELTAAGLPAVLVPGTFAGGHQADNARWLEQGGAAVVLEEKDLRRLPDTVINLLEDESRLAAMRKAARSLAKPDAARDIAKLIREAAKQ